LNFLYYLPLSGRVGPSGLGRMKYLTVIACVSWFYAIGCSTLCIAQSADPKKARQLFEKKNYSKVLPLYLDLAKSDPGNTYYNFCLGLCYFHSTTEKHKAIDQLEKSIVNFGSLQNSSPEDAFYALGRAYHISHRFDEAIKTYTKYKSLVQSDMVIVIGLLKKRFERAGKGMTEKEFASNFINTDPVIQVFKALIRKTDEQIKRCNFGKVLVSNPMDVIVENLGDIINSEYSEYAPVVSSDEKLIIFTRRDPRTTGGKIAPDGDYYEDIYLTSIEEGSLFKKTAVNTNSSVGYIDIVGDMKFSPPQSISSQINTVGHEGAIQLSFEGDKLYFYKSSQVWTSTNIGNEWSEPIKVSGLENILNTKAFEPSLSISIEEDVIFIVSDRKGGKGGLDIYKSIKKLDGTWGPAVNLEDVNTPFDEDGPYTDPDGSTFYFSSKGHSSMGGYDIFKSQFKGDYWTRPPQNMGAPINSAEDDIFYMMTPRYNRAYYSSAKTGGFGGMDIYRLTFANERNQLAEVKGLVLEGDKLIPAFSKITIIDDEHDTEISSHYSDSTSGDYLLLLGHGKSYTMRVETQGFVPYVKKFHIPSQVYYYQFYQEVHHVHIKDTKGNVIGQKVTVNNAMFDIDKVVSPIVRPDMVPQKEVLQLKANNLLNSYEDYLDEKPTASIDSAVTETDSLAVRSAEVFESYQNLMTEFAQSDATVDTSLAQGVLQEKAIELLKEHEALKQSIQDLDTVTSTQTPLDTARTKTMDVLDIYSDFVRNIAAFSPRSELSEEESAEYKNLDKTASYSKFIGSGQLNEVEFEVEEVTDVKFYISQDSLVSLMKEDPVVKKQIIEILSKPKKQQKPKVEQESSKEQVSSEAQISEVAQDTNAALSLKVKEDSQKEQVESLEQISQEVPDSSLAQHLSLDQIFEKGRDAIAEQVVDVMQVSEEEQGQSSNQNLREEQDTSVEQLSEQQLASSTVKVSNTETVQEEAQPVVEQGVEGAAVVPEESGEGTLTKPTKSDPEPSLEELFSELEIYFFEPEEEGDVARDELDAYVLPKGHKEKVEVEPEQEAEPEPEESIAESLTEPTEPETNLYFVNDFPGIGEDDVLLNNVERRDQLEPFFEEADGAAKIVVLFGFDNNFFPSSARQAFEWTSELISENPSMTFEVLGHTDSKGPMLYNLKLSGKRAQAIINYFLKQGLDAGRFTVVEKGESAPLLPNIQLNGEDDVEGMRMNRRVEIKIMSR